MTLFSQFRPLLYRLDEETAHNLALKALPWLPKTTIVDNPALHVNLFGLKFNNPLGLAAGFDKNAQVLAPLLRQGFGFVEAGTVTPHPQPGNPKPRLFRLEEDEAIINRMGFNNKGADAFYARLVAFRSGSAANSIIGVNIGKNKTQEDAASDYVSLLERFGALASYITVNISSPNTPGLRLLQQGSSLKDLLQAISETREHLAQKGVNPPVLLKIAPDLSPMEAETTVMSAINHKIDGIIISNTTISGKEALNSPKKSQDGGLSGKPLMAASTALLKHIYRSTEGAIPLIGVGGISNADDAYAKIRAGATLIQLYSALIYKGFSLSREINQGLTEHLKRDGFTSITQAVGVDAK